MADSSIKSDSSPSNQANQRKFSNSRKRSFFKDQKCKSHANGKNTVYSSIKEEISNETDSSKGSKKKGHKMKLKSAASTRSFELNEFIGNLVEILKTHSGSVKMQKQIANASFNDINMMIEEIKGDFAALMND